VTGSARPDKELAMDPVLRTVLIILGVMAIIWLALSLADVI
jgi:hypothetical protein